MDVELAVLAVIRLLAAIPVWRRFISSCGTFRRNTTFAHPLTRVRSLSQSECGSRGVIWCDVCERRSDGAVGRLACEQRSVALAECLGQVLPDLAGDHPPRQFLFSGVNDIEKQKQCCASSGPEFFARCYMQRRDEERVRARVVVSTGAQRSFEEALRWHQQRPPLRFVRSTRLEGES